MTFHQPITRDAEPRLHQITQRDYLLLSDHGAFSDYAKSELLEGEIVVLNARYSPHIRVQSRLYRSLADACDLLGNELEAFVEGSIGLTDVTMPEPDMFVSAGLPDSGSVTFDRMALVVEVSDTTLASDLGRKQRIYAAAAIPEYWVADVSAGEIEQMWSPSQNGYSERRRVRFGDPITVETIAGLTVDTARLV